MNLLSFYVVTEMLFCETNDCNAPRLAQNVTHKGISAIIPRCILIVNLKNNHIRQDFNDRITTLVYRTIINCQSINTELDM